MNTEISINIYTKDRDINGYIYIYIIKQYIYIHTMYNDICSRKVPERFQ